MKHPKYKVVVQHYRFEKNYKYLLPNYAVTVGRHAPRGGATVVRLINLESQEQFYGYSFCSKDDSYVRKDGRELALKRALILAESEDEEELLSTAAINNLAHNSFKRYYEV